MRKFKPGDVITYKTRTINGSSSGIVLHDPDDRTLVLSTFNHGDGWFERGRHRLSKTSVKGIDIHPDGDRVYAEWAAGVLTGKYK